jgi:hypothetical protein
MVERRNSRDGTAFWGCSTFPACRGTRPLADGVIPAPKAKPRLSTGGRPKGWGDDVELALARVTGRNFGLVTGFLLRVAMIVVVVILFVNLIGPVSTWFGQYMADVFVQSMATPTPAATVAP